MPDPCIKIRTKTETLSEQVADLKAEIADATGSVLHGLAGQLNLALHQLARAQQELADCEASTSPGGGPPVVVPPVEVPPVSVPDECLADRIKVAMLEEQIADLRDQIADATGGILHALAGQLTLALGKLRSARRELAECEHSFAGFAILLCHWSDDDKEPQNRQFFEDLFTSSGAGSLNMTDYFSDCSHGKITLEGTEVFGWFDMGFPRSAYVGNSVPKANQLNRQAMMAQAKAVANAQGVNLAGFVGVVVCFNVQTDLFGGEAGACCDLQSFIPSVLGQEMGHVYGLDHSRRDGSTDDYRDNWDTMSTYGSTFRATHPRWTEVGPGLNGLNMRSQGWLDEKRVFRSVRTTFDQMVDLRPLHHRELPGFLGAELPGPSGQTLFVEFRDVARWDAGIPEPVVLVHRFEDNHSYIMHDTAGIEGLTPGKVFQYGEVNSQSKAFGSVEVLNIDAQNRTARVRLRHRAATGIVAEPPNEAIHTDGGAANGDDAVRANALKTVIALAERELGKSDEFSAPAPKPSQPDKG